MRIMFTSLGGHGHFRPMAPLAQALRDAHHDVVVATMESLRSSVEDLGLEMLPVGVAYAEAMRRLNAAHPELQSLGPEEESRRVVTDLFVGIFTPSILEALPRLLAWAPDVVVREEGEFAGPIVAAKAGVPWVDHGWGPMRPPEMVAAAAAALHPLWRAHGLEPDAAGGAYRWLYLDPCPPSPSVSIRSERRGDASRAPGYRAIAPTSIRARLDRPRSPADRLRDARHGSALRRRLGVLPDRDRRTGR